MKNFRWHKDSIIYRDRPEGDVVEVMVAYAKGGVSMFTYKQEARGIYVHVTPKNIEKRDGVTIASQTLLGNMKQSGAKLFFLALNRRSDKKMEAVAEMLDEAVPTIAALFRTDPDAAFQNLIPFRDELTAAAK